MKPSVKSDETPPVDVAIPWVQPTLSFYRPHARVTFTCVGPSMTKQSFKDECDINNILNQYKMTGIIEHISTQTPLYTDLPSDMDYQSSLHVLMQADESFASLPSVVREHFQNDPQQFLAAFSDPEGRKKLIEWGVITPPPAPRPPDTVPEPKTE